MREGGEEKREGEGRKGRRRGVEGGGLSVFKAGDMVAMYIASIH